MQIVHRLLALIATLALLVVGAWYIGSIRTKLEFVETRAVTAEKALVRAQDTLRTREAVRTKRTEENAAKAVSLDLVMTKNPSWAETTVPQEVQDDLCKTLRCTRDLAGPAGLRGPTEAASAADRSP